jgi:UDP-glucose 4-epimerase
VFSSSAAVYAAETGGGVDESGALAPSSPYASTKAMVEQILRDAAVAGDFRAIALRYFNPIGADPRLRTGLQNPRPTHALGKIMQAKAEGVPFTITGTDWPTRDGSGRVINLGTGDGVTVRELVAAFERVTGETLPVVDAPRRAGDQAGAFAIVERAHDLLGWRAERSTDDGVRDALDWAEKLPAVRAASDAL